MKQRDKHENIFSAEEDGDKSSNLLSLKLLDLLINKAIRNLQKKSYKPKVQDDLKAI